MSACAKFILLGEHSVLYQGIGLAFPLLDLKLSVKKLPETDQLYFNGLLQDNTKRETLTKLSEHLKINIPRKLGINIISDIPIGAGLGSSAALCCALLRTFSEVPLLETELAKRAMEGEHYFHGRSSGIDPFAIAFEKPLKFDPHNLEFHSLNINVLKTSAYGFIILDSQQPHSTKNISNNHKTQRDPNWRNTIDELADLALTGAHYLENGDFEKLGKNMNAAHEALTRLGVSTPSLNNLVTQLKEFGALGAKLTGAGKGGCVIALLSHTKINEFIYQNPTIKAYRYLPSNQAHH